MHPVDAKQLSTRRRLRRFGRDERGFTLIEALAATVVLAVGALALIGVFNDSRDQSATGERHQIALMQAEQAIEELRGIPYKNLMLTDGAVDPTGGARVTGGGAQLQVKPGLSETLVYPGTEGVPASQAWVQPVTTTGIGAQDVELDVTIHRFVSWRDEECRIIDLGALPGLDLPGAIGQVQAPLTNLVTGLLDQVIGLLLLSSSNKTLLNNLKTRLTGLRNALNAHQGQIGDAIAGITELDLCDLELSALQELQNLGLLTPALNAPGALTQRLQSLQQVLNSVLVLLLNQSQISGAVGQVNSQLNCMFGSGSQQAQFNSYLSGIVDGLGNLVGDLAHTDKNTKRITVAVTVAPRGGVGPFQPVWASSVVRDPAAGILTAGGASCA